MAIVSLSGSILEVPIDTFWANDATTNTNFKYSDWWAKQISSLQIFEEAQDIVLQENISIHGNLQNPDWDDLTNLGAIAAGTEVDSHFIAFKSPTPGTNVTVEATVTFDAPIIGFMGDPTLINPTNDLFVPYVARPLSGGGTLDMSASGFDAVEILDGGYTLRVIFKNTSAVDPLRVLTSLSAQSVIPPDTETPDSGTNDDQGTDSGGTTNSGGNDNTNESGGTPNAGGSNNRPESDIDALLGEPLELPNFKKGRKGKKFRGDQKPNRMQGTGLNDTFNGKGDDDVIKAKGGNDTARGKDGRDKVYGQGGIDRLYGGDGNDLLKGGSGRDLLEGGNGNDRLIGQGGHDILIGGNGKDKLTGNRGKDTFTFEKLSDSMDVITDFQPGEDKLYLRKILDGSEFAADTLLSKFQNFVKLIQRGNATVVHIDGNGNAPGEELERLVKLRNVNIDTIQPTDFLI